jgi:tripartite-type tricarboxylate transporter receptor subunit TctC
MLIATRLAPRLLAFALVFAAALAPAAAQDAANAKAFPDKPIHLIVPFPAGGPADTIARFLGQKMTEHWNQPVIIENRAGGNTAIGAQAVAKSPADGYTLLVAMDVTMVMNPLLYTNLTYDPAKDLVPITLLTRSMSLIVVRSDGPKTLKELIAKAKANPGKLNMGAGTVTSRLGALAFAQAAGMDVQLIPYKGSAEITQGLLTGSVDFTIDSLSNSLALIQAGKFRPLAKYSSRPLPNIPDIPALQSINEAADLPDLSESSVWIGLVGPAGTPKPIVDKLQHEIANIYADPVIFQKLDKAGLFPTDSKSAAEFDDFIRSEKVRWGEVIKEHGGAKLLN